MQHLQFCVHNMSASIKGHAIHSMAASLSLVYAFFKKPHHNGGVGYACNILDWTWVFAYHMQTSTVARMSCSLQSTRMALI